jgi:hypothetical protein
MNITESAVECCVEAELMREGRSDSVAATRGEEVLSVFSSCNQIAC